MFILTLLKSISPVSALVGAVVGAGVPAVTTFVRKQLASAKAKVETSAPKVVAEVKSATANVVSEVEKKL